MKSATIAATVLASVAFAQPHAHHRRHHHDKRDYVVEWETKVETITVVADGNSYETIYPSQTAQAAPSASSSGSPGQFFQGSSSAASSRSTSVAAVSHPSSQTAAAPVPTTLSISSVAKPSTTSVPVPVVPSSSSVAAPVVPSSSSVAAPIKPSSTAAAPPASSSAASSGGGGGASKKQGIMTYYQVGMGTCGWDDSGKDKTDNIVAMGAGFMNSISSLTSYGINQPANPLCGETITIVASNGKSTTGIIRDKCPGCQSALGIDVSEKIFVELMGGTDAGTAEVTWYFNDGKY